MYIAYIGDLRITTHDSRSRRIANPYQVEEFHLQSLADLARRTGCPMVSPKNPHTFVKILVTVILSVPAVKITLTLHLKK